MFWRTDAMRYGQRDSRPLMVVLAGIAMVASPAVAHGQVNGAPAAAPVVTREVVESRLQEVEDTKDLADEEKAKIRELFQQALQDLDLAADLAARAAAFEEMAATAPARYEQAKAKRDQMPAETSIDVPESATLADLEQLLKQNETDLAKLKQEFDRLDAEQARRQTRRSEIPASATSVRERMAHVEKQLLTPPPSDEPPLFTVARQMGQRVERQLLEQELTSNDKELAAYTAETTEFLNAQRDLAGQLAGQAETRVAALREITNRRRQQEAKRLAADADLDLDQADPLLEPEAKRNTELAQRSERLGKTISTTSQKLERTNQDLDRIKREFQSIQEKVDRGGLTEGIGLLLRRQLATLPDVREHQRQLQTRRTEIRTTELNLIDLDDERYQLSDTERVADRMLEELSPLPADVKWEDLRQALRELLETRKELLDKLIQSQGSYFDLLIQLDSSEDELIREVEAYTEYLRERVLWIRSGWVLQPRDVPAAGEAMVWLVRPDNWRDVFWAAFPYGHKVSGMLQSDTPRSWSEIMTAVGEDIVRRPQSLVTSILFLVYVVVLVSNQRRLRTQIRELGEQAARRNCQRFPPTFHALVDTLFVSLLWPSLLLFFAWRLTTTAVTDDFVRAVGYGLGITGVHYFSLEFARQVCRPQGLADAHFDWPDEAISVMRRTIKTLLFVTLPIVFVVTTLQGQSDEAWQISLGRISFVAGLAFLATLSHRVLRPGSAFHRGFERAAGDGLLFRLRHIWYWGGMSSLLTLIVLALVGYYYTAYELTFRIQETLWLLLVLFLLASLVLRWLLVSRRKLAIEQALERRRAARAQAAAAEQSESITAADFVSETELDLGEMSQQSRQLLRVGLFAAGLLGLWLIWVDVLPALGILEGVKIWEVDFQDGKRWITLEHLVFCLIILGLTILAVRNLPGLLELTLLQRLPLDAGARYAITTCVRYLITVIGVIVAFRTIGIEWSQYQWLVAAAGVGLGFGLQEIFANFVSGLIVLIERPVRVGDIVTIADVTGVVSRIRMRATTVTNWDRQEFIVPNKEFVTGRLLNWTLSNAINRIVVKVGVAYGSDTERAKELLLQVASDNPHVLKEPAPMATFEGFGDSTLDFVLRCYLPTLDNRLATIHQLHTEIHTRFAEAGLEIAFPQRDIHIRSPDPSVVTS
ncbi:MAG: mechanosensitive ion channel domain-containing protein [Pirellulaceae bacterium]